MREYAVVLLTAALVTYLATPVVRMVAIRFRMMAAPRERDVHVIPTPRLGGVAIYLGVAAAVLVATRLPDLQRTFDDSQIYGVLVAGGLICLLGALDDMRDLDSLTKLAGQIAAAGVMAYTACSWRSCSCRSPTSARSSLRPRHRRAADDPGRPS